jgi:DNA polymerase-4
VITPVKGPAFVASLPVSRFHGVGPKTAERMARLGIVTGADLRACSLEFLAHNFGSSGPYYHDLARGICHRRVSAHRIRKSIGAEDTFFEDLRAEPALAPELARIADTVWSRIGAKGGISGRTVTLKVKYQDFRIITRSRSLDRPVSGRDEFLEIGVALLRATLPAPKGIRLLGLTLSNLSNAAPEPVQVVEPALPL